MVYSNRHNVHLAPACDAANIGRLWYVMVGHRCIALLHGDETSNVARVQAVIDNALDKLNEDTAAYMTSIT